VGLRRAPTTSSSTTSDGRLREYSVSSFERLHPALQHHIVNSLGWRDLRPVQELSIDATLDGLNTIVLAPTAGGKTEAAFFPLISKTLAKEWPGLSVLYVSPIKALLNNQEYRLRYYYELVGHRVGVWHGDASATSKKRMVSDAPDCLLTTPESLEVMLVSQNVPHREILKDVQAIVVDEVHAFAGDDRGWHLLSLLSRISRIAGRDIQRIGLSATVGNPEFLLEWLSAGSNRGRSVIAPPTDSPVEPKVELDYVGTLSNAAKVISALHRGEKRLVFVDSRARVESLASELRALEVKTFVSHSSLGVDERRQAESAFASGNDCVIVATSALELGIDVGDLDRVIQIDAPSTVSSFLQRMGRTGRRAGTERNCLFLATSDDSLLRAGAIIELWLEGYVEPIEPPPEPLHILAQQLMALSLQEGGVGRSEWFDWIQAVPAFAEIELEVRERVVDGMLESGILWEDNGILSLGEEGEKEYGRRNFLELFAVFSAPPLFTVRHGKEDLGFVHQSTFLARDQGPVVLLLGGRSWDVKYLDWKRRVAQVVASKEKGRSRWMGQGQLFSYRLCQAIRRELVEDGDRSYWSQRAQRQFAEVRDGYEWLAADGTTLISTGTHGFEWWTFGGGNANGSLARALGEEIGRECVADNFFVRSKESAALEDVAHGVDALRDRPRESLTPAIDEKAIDGLKFSACLPEDLAHRVLERRLTAREDIDKVVGRPVRSLRQDAE